MRIGVPKEIKNNEFRVGVTPGSAREYIARGHEVYVETNAGTGIGAEDAVYEAVGAKILSTAKEVFDIAEMIVKVKEPQPSEWSHSCGKARFYIHICTWHQIQNKQKV